MTSDTLKYCNCMEEVRHRISLVQAVLDGAITTGYRPFDIELIFVQLRKTLELVAFASLTANKEKYASAHADFATHWRAKRMLQTVERLNPNFYPVPIELPRLLENGVKHCEQI